MTVDLIQQVLDFYQQIEEQTASIPDQINLHCPPGCGRCCDNPNIEATPLEMLPVAWELWQRGEALTYWQNIKNQDTPSVCIFYERDALIPGNGRCEMYPWRPIVCRLFGYATVKNKQGISEFATCAYHHQTEPEKVAEIKHQVTTGFPILNFSEISLQLALIDPNKSQRLPINQALCLAIEQIGLIKRLNS